MPVGLSRIGFTLQAHQLMLLPKRDSDSESLTTDCEIVHCMGKHKIALKSFRGSSFLRGGLSIVYADREFRM